MKKLIPVVIIAVMFHLFIPSSALGLSNPENLKGIKSIGLVIEGLPPEATNFGLLKKTLQTDVELKLRLLGIYDNSSLGYLYLNVNLLADTHSVSGNVSVTVRQFAMLETSAQIAMVTIWGVAEVFTAKKSSAESMIRKIVKDSVDEFLNDYLEANPRKTPSN